MKIFKYFVTQNAESSNNTHIDIGKLLPYRIRRISEVNRRQEIAIVRVDFILSVHPGTKVKASRFQESNS